MLRIIVCTISLLLISIEVSGHEPQQDRHKSEGIVVRVDNPPVIDANPLDNCWSKSNTFENFRQYEPFSGAPSRFRTIVRMVYDDEAIYVCAVMYDPFPDSIRAELGQRDADNSIVADYFNVDIGPYNDGINAYSFKLTASGIQTDIRRSSGTGGRDVNWDAVWKSSSVITDSGWVAEIKIPFSAIRFPAEGVNKWGVNFWRFIQRDGEWSSWNYADKTFGTTINYLGNMSGFTGINPPVRISVSPYMSGYIENQAGSGSWGKFLKVGADLKIGLSESFTLDATVVPDFKQIQADDQVLNLTPFEIKYNERRQFFTEGTDVFGKADIFYSKRIGSKPSGFNDVYKTLADTEFVELNPPDTRLINAAKISGRTKGGLGIGIFNAITGKAEAIIGNSTNNSTREFETQPMTNYNMVVLDQNLGGGSYISLVNTNVLRSGPATGRNYTANVTAADVRYLNPSRIWSFGAVPAVSQKYFSGTGNQYGYSVSVAGGKTGGNFRLFFSHLSISEKYDPNDMGYLRNNNLFNNQVTTGYNIYQPKGIILSSLNTLSVSHEMLYFPRRFTSVTVSADTKTTFKDLSILTLITKVKPLRTNDYYEPRSNNMYYSRPSATLISAGYVTDSRKVVSVSFNGELELFGIDNNMGRYEATLIPTLRYNNRFVFSHSLKLEYLKNDIGYVEKDVVENVVFGERNNATIENTSTVSYIFSPVSYLDLRLRHYWSKAEYTGVFYWLQNDGRLSQQGTSLAGRDINLNFLNIDLGYTWRFAPGSELSIYWKNSIYQSGNTIYKTFRENYKALVESPAVNSFSLKILYYLDYHSIRSGN
jgi:hypothetical protein